MLNLFRRLSLIVCLCWHVTICTAQSNVDSLITPSSLKEIVQALAADSFQGRLTGSKEAVQVAHFIADAFKKGGALPVAGNDGYFMLSKIKYGVPSPVNVVAAIPGRSKAKELVIFSAHYDHIGTTSSSSLFKTPTNQISEKGNPEKGDEIYNGANDNASGVSGLIHLARYFGKLKNNERTLLFIAFSGEELGLLGSEKMAASFDPKVIKAMINMDMIGRPLSQNRKYPYITGSEKSDLRKLLNKKLYELAPDYGKKYFQIDAFPNENLFNRSDNYPFAARGVAAHTIMTSSPNDMYYHSLNDEWETLDYPFMAEIVKAIALGSTGLAEGSDTP